MTDDKSRCMRCLQANLAYLASIADRAHKPASQKPPAPAIMAAPENMPGLADAYQRLLALFPDSSPAMKASPNPASRDISAGPVQDGVVAASAAAPPSSNGTGPASSTEKSYKQWLDEMGKTPLDPDKSEQDYKAFLAREAQQQQQQAQAQAQAHQAQSQ